ncbi:MAG: tetratricopeptide repeat protein, partial [Flavobacteriales bacterium]
LGQSNLGLCYLNGNGCEVDESRALDLFQNSADQGNPHGIANLGYMYETGSGGAPQDLDKARMHYKNAADLGSEFAAERLQYLNN